MPKSPAFWQQIPARIRHSPTGSLLWLCAAAGLGATLLMARHSSTEPAVLGRWSLRYAGLLALTALATLLTGALGIPALRARLLRRSARPASRRRAWTLLAAGLALLPALHAALRAGLLPGNDRALALLLSLLPAGMAALILAVLWRSGVAEQFVTLRRPALCLLLLLAAHLLLATRYLDQVPRIESVDETGHIANALRQFHLPDRFVLLRPDHNARTWIDFSGYWLPFGAWLSVFGAGIQPARFFNLLVAWLALPFLYVTARALHGRAAAFATATLAIAMPLHFVSARSDVWVATATAIALCCHILARETKTQRPRLLRFLCGFCALSAVDAHPYGIFFALIFVLLNLPEILRRPQAGSAGSSSGLRGSFLAGCAAYTLLWLSYHIVLPGVPLAALPDLFRATWSMESGLGLAQGGTGLNSANLLKVLQQFFYFQPYLALLAAPALLATLLRRRPGDRELLLLAAGSALLVMLTLAHVNPYYAIFWLTLLCLLVGIWLARLLRPALHPTRNDDCRLTFGALYLLLATLILSVIQLELSATLNLANNEGARRVIEVGREIDRLLPAEDIAVAGTYEIALGMPLRLNFGGYCSFTREDSKYWPLAAPQAIVYTPGWDRGCHLLADWLVEYDFRPARCFAIPHLGDGVTILYLLPELMQQERDTHCAPEDLAWQDREA